MIEIDRYRSKLNIEFCDRDRSGSASRKKHIFQFQPITNSRHRSISIDIEILRFLRFLRFLKFLRFLRWGHRLAMYGPNITQKCQDYRIKTFLTQIECKKVQNTFLCQFLNIFNQKRSRLGSVGIGKGKLKEL